MKKIAILSGKGGVGKSSIAASLAIALKERNIVLVDADADCPNLHLLFEGTEKSSKVLQASQKAVIDYKKCTNCGKCKNVCKFGALEYSDKPKINELFCEGCNACKVVCPENAIKIIPVDTGEAKVIETRAGFPLVYGRLYPGKAGSGKIVHDVRAIADKIAAEKKAELMIIDSAAGIGCPVIASILGCDHVIGVVEPTPSGIRDTSRAMETAEHFKIPCSIVINKVGISKDNEEEIRKKWSGKILAELPYDPEVPKLLASRLPPILGKGRIKSELEKLATAVRSML